MTNFNFQVVITESCNMGCTYCYMANVPTLMTEEMFDKHYDMLPQMMERYGCDTYTLALFGGEPTTNMKLVKYILEKIKEDKRCTQKIMMTNGILLINEEIQETVREYGLGLSISFDGLWNKKQRPMVSGESSFDHYVEHKDFYNKSSCKVMVAPDSLDTLVENFKWFVEDFGISDPDFTIVRDDIWNNGDVGKFRRESHKLKMAIVEYNLRGIPAMAGFYQLYILDTLFGRLYSKRQFTCFAGNSGAGFMPDGEIYACARYGSEKKLPIGNSNTQTFNHDHGESIEDEKVYNPTTFEKCKSCLLEKYCNAGCSFSQLKQNENTGDFYSSPIDSICEILDILYADAYDLMDRLKDNETFKQTMQNAVRNVG